ncbi:MAG: 4Fe-4S dicluster-binding protein [Bdellovibrionota bacterium]
MIIGSIMAPGHDMQAWARLVEEMNKAGCDALELNLGCPHGMTERDMGAICSQDAEIVFNIVQTAKSVSKIPILTKLTPNVTNIKVMADAARKAGTDAITVINTVNGIIGIDIRKREPLLSVNGLTAIGGISGNAVKPVGLKCVAECKQATGLPVSATGGISSWSDGVEYLLMGADQLQVCSEIMIRGFKIIQQLNKGLARYMEEMGYSRLQEVKGELYKSVTSFETLLKTSSAEKVKVNEETCTGCKLCVVACEDAGYHALAMKSAPPSPRTLKPREVADVIVQNCTGCNLCVAVCPVPDCMSLYDSKQTFPYELHASYAENTLSSSGSKKAAG